MGKIIFITGGARSGKSTFAEQLCMDSSLQVSYIATAQILDDEMKDRIEKHRKRRPTIWKTYEIQYDLPHSLPMIMAKSQMTLLDCVTVYVANYIFKEDIDFSTISMEEITILEEKILEEFQTIISIAKNQPSHLILVTNELGMGIVPENKLSRIYRDIIGRVNQRCATCADDVFFLVSGIPLKVKGEDKSIYV